ncbi:acylamide-delta3(E)-desaturase [Teratosphaeria destructans]|uniref:Acylamide-delta3(E)-desaturase n=1 Tax=Teratosphaeria destructans TaxID=418781 RepID=A0A9W7W796_9PEZI|nr:acylamide-delta3(E)-desaturase [Teratosphaeria destructans]
MGDFARWLATTPPPSFEHPLSNMAPEPAQIAVLPPNPSLTKPDLIVLENLYRDIQHDHESSEKIGQDDDKQVIERLRAMNNPSHPDYEPTVLSMYDRKDIPEWINRYILDPYSRIAVNIVRHPTDIVFLTHILWDACIIVPSAIYLYRNFSYLHAVLHAAHAVWCAGPFTLMMHNHIHNHGILAKPWKWFDSIFPYVLEPLMGHTWDSYYYHHVKHHHVENNGPEDLSSTIRYQRDDILHFLHYEGRFLLLVWYDLPLYFLRKNQPMLASRAFASEFGSYALFYLMARIELMATVFVFLIPLFLMRLALMIGNWGQHALQPVAFTQQRQLYADGKALVFHDIDFFMMTVKLLSKDYGYLADHLVPIGDQVNMSKTEIADMLRTKTRKFTEEEIMHKFRQKRLSASPQSLVAKEML